jgi:hypothetical protein
LRWKRAKLFSLSYIALVRFLFGCAAYSTFDLSLNYKAGLHRLLETLGVASSGTANAVHDEPKN